MQVKNSQTILLENISQAFLRGLIRNDSILYIIGEYLFSNSYFTPILVY